MTDNLNERVAMAIGWTVQRNKFGGVLLTRGDHEALMDMPMFATDPATIPEMLEFLSSHAFKGGWESYSLTWQGAKVGGWQACFARVRGDVIAWGETLNLALANLVVAVAEATT